jgi:hypothetical protein
MRKCKESSLVALLSDHALYVKDCIFKSGVICWKRLLLGKANICIVRKYIAFFIVDTDNNNCQLSNGLYDEYGFFM